MSVWFAAQRPSQQWVVRFPTSVVGSLRCSPVLRQYGDQQVMASSIGLRIGFIRSWRHLWDAKEPRSALAVPEVIDRGDLVVLGFQ